MFLDVRAVGEGASPRLVLAHPRMPNTKGVPLHIAQCIPLCGTGKF